MNEIKLSVVIVNYNQKYYLEQALVSLRAATVGFDIEIIVVDNNAVDGAGAYLSARFHEVTFISNVGNGGIAQGNNIAFRYVHGEYVLFMHPDILLGEDVLRTMCFFLDEHPKVAGVGARVIDASGKYYKESCRIFPTPSDYLLKVLGLSFFMSRNNQHRFAKLSLNASRFKPYKIESLWGAFMMMRSRVFRELGGMDENFFLYGEDLDFSKRLIDAGYETYCIPETVLHYQSKFTRDENRFFVNAYYRSMLLYFSKYYKTLPDLYSNCLKAAVMCRWALSPLFKRKNDGVKELENKKRRVLLVCNEILSEEIKTQFNRRFGKSAIERWAIERKSLEDLLNRLQQRHSFTDIVYCFDDMRFEQIIHKIEQFYPKTIINHIYCKETGVLVSPGMARM
ncbi:MAG: glycosyltransferase family 2 protein [Tannerellaceae bacterium]